MIFFKVAPHHDCFIHAQLVASTPAGLIVEVAGEAAELIRFACSPRQKTLPCRILRMHSRCYDIKCQLS